MQDIFKDGWHIILILTALLAVIDIIKNRAIIKFTFPKNNLLMSILTACIFSGALYLLNPSIDLVLFLIPFIVGVVLSLFMQSYYDNTENISAIFTYFVVVIIYLIHLFYQLSINDVILMLGYFSLAFLSTMLIRLFRTEKLSGNIYSCLSVLLPFYCGFSWLNLLQLDPPETDLKIITLFIVGLVALTYSTLISHSKDKPGLRIRIETLLFSLMVIYLLLCNVYAMDMTVVYLVIGGFIFAQILELVNNKMNKNDLVVEMVWGICLILLAGFFLTRIFGTWGLVIVSICCISTIPVSNNGKSINWPVIASLFLLCKVLTNTFIQQASLNVTGININHPYVYVGLMLGLILPFIILGIILKYKEQILAYNFILLLVFGLLLPVMSNYLIYSEASGSLLIGFSTAALIIAIGGKIIGYDTDNKLLRVLSNGMLPLSTLIGIILITTQNIIEIGVQATRIERLEYFLAAAIFVVLLFILVLNISKRKPEEFCCENED